MTHHVHHGLFSSWKYRLRGDLCQHREGQCGQCVAAPPPLPPCCVSPSAVQTGPRIHTAVSCPCRVVRSSYEGE